MPTDPNETEGPSKEVRKTDLISWSWVASSSRRENALEGLLLGCAVGEALALARDGYSRRQAIRLFGASPARFKFIPNVGFPGERFHSVIMTIQAMLASRASHREFAKKLSVRRRWYVVGSPARATVRMLRPAFTAKPDEIPVPRRLIGDPLPRAAAISLMIQGSQSGEPWVDISTALTVNGKGAADVSLLVAQAVQLAQMLDPAEPRFSPLDAIETLIYETSDPVLRKYLLHLRTCLENRYSLARASRSLGWKRGVPYDLRAIAVMAIYAWLRHPFRFRFAVERAVFLGGASAAVGAIAGCLSGVTLGKRGIPNEWLKLVTLYPHDRQWQDELIERVKDWPHGVEDIQNAKAEQTFVLGQLARNITYSTFRLIHVLIRIPGRLVP